MVAIPVVCAAGAYGYFDEVLQLRNPMYPTFFVLLLSAVVSQCCASVFECMRSMHTLSVPAVADPATTPPAPAGLCQLPPAPRSQSACSERPSKPGR